MNLNIHKSEPVQLVWSCIALKCDHQMTIAITCYLTKDVSKKHSE